MDIKSIFKKWEPRKTSKEDSLLSVYVAKNPGLYFTEVPVGNPGSYPWDSPSNPRKIDAVRIIGTKSINHRIFKSGKDIAKLKKVFLAKRIQLIEAKQQLNRTVIGQLLVARELFEEQYNPKKISLLTLLNENITDGALYWVCKNRFDIQVINQIRASK